MESINTTSKNNPIKMLILATDSSDKFTDISEYLIDFFENKQGFKVTSKRNNFYKTLNIGIILKKKSETNPMNYDLHFSLTLENDYPLTQPILKAITHFSFPTLFDNRNLIYSVYNQNWVPSRIDVGDHIAEPLSEIILNLPKFMNRLIENTQNKILVYYGDYKIDTIYEMNDFLSNLELDFFRVQQNVKKDKKKERYVVLTDIYLLFLDPVPQSKNLAKLLFWGDIRQVGIKEESPFSKTLTLEWKNKDQLLGFQVEFSDPREFRQRCIRKSQRLADQYKIFQDDIAKPGEETVNLNTCDLNKLQQLVKYKEELLKTTHSVNIITELMSLYQKIIELQSAKGEDFEIYLQKMQQMLKNKDIQLH